MNEPLSFYVVVGFTILSFVSPYIAWMVWKLRLRRRRLEVERLEKLPTFAADFTTAQGAILRFEDALRRRDIEAAVEARDFEAYARFTQEAAADLRDAFREETLATWPELDGVRSFFISCEPYAPGVVAVTEKLVPPEGELIEQVVLVSETERGFRVSHVL